LTSGPHDPDRSSRQARGKILGQPHDPVERNISQAFNPLAYHKGRKDEVGRICIRETFGILRSFVGRPSNVIGSAHEGLTAVMMPMTELMAGTEPFSVRFRFIMDVDDGAVPEADDLRLTSDQSPVLHFRADAMSDRFEIDVFRVGYAEIGQ
jgi:hypothetical protein